MPGNDARSIFLGEKKETCDRYSAFWIKNLIQPGEGKINKPNVTNKLQVNWKLFLCWPACHHDCGHGGGGGGIRFLAKTCHCNYRTTDRDRGTHSWNTQDIGLAVRGNPVINRVRIS